MKKQSILREMQLLNERQKQLKDKLDETEFFSDKVKIIDEMLSINKRLYKLDTLNKKSLLQTIKDKIKNLFEI